MELQDLKAHPRNPRKISAKQQEMLQKSLKEFGDLSCIIENQTNKLMVGAHQRIKLLPKNAKIAITKEYSPPTPQGTVAIGYVEVDGEQFKFRRVAWDEAKHSAAMIAANQHGGDFDYTGLTDLLTELDAMNFDLDLTGFDNKELENLMAPMNLEPTYEKDLYTKKIESPIYTPKGPKPGINELFDVTKTASLINQIENSKLPADEKAFLKLAAQRHAVFNYEKIAEFYSHSPEETKDLMEKSALVIIDFEKAIENGFVELTKKLAEIYADEPS